jgi:hypothetical protein
MTPEQAEEKARAAISGLHDIDSLISAVASALLETERETLESIERFAGAEANKWREIAGRARVQTEERFASGRCREAEQIQTHIRALIPEQPK